MEANSPNSQPKNDPVTEVPANKMDTNSSTESRSHKRKREDQPGRGNKSGSNRGGKGRKRDMGREEYFRSNPDRRQKTEDSKIKRQNGGDDGELSTLVKPFTPDEIAAEDRKPKRKVAVMLGYSGSGYKGMQIMPNQKTIEGDLFAAFVSAGAISKANADDPKKSSFVRCARTDKGVHAAGNVISIKLIIDDPDIVKKINDNLSPQIRIWGFERTTGSFSCYQACDSRWYEYLIPTHCFLPPHPQSFLGKKIVELAREADDLESYSARQREVEDFWEKTDLEIIKPILDSLDESTRMIVEEALYHTRASRREFEEADEETEDLRDEDPVNDDNTAKMEEVNENSEKAISAEEEKELGTEPETADRKALEAAIKSLKAAYIKAKEAYRIHPTRLERVREAFSKYVGTHNFHNFTVRKSATDPSAKRHILSFTVSPKPILINDTEWLSLKVHGQSFMMHQIRKMVGLAALVVRCGTFPDRIAETLGKELISIPKAPGLGLLLERPVFSNYNESTAVKFGMKKIGFEIYEKEIEEFKAREIYDRIFREEDADHIFHSFFTNIDNYKEKSFLYLSSKGIDACGPTPRMAATVHEPSRKERKIYQQANHPRNKVTKVGEKIE